MKQEFADDKLYGSVKKIYKALDDLDPIVQDIVDRSNELDKSMYKMPNDEIIRNIKFEGDLGVVVAHKNLGNIKDKKLAMLFAIAQIALQRVDYYLEGQEHKELDDGV